MHPKHIFIMGFCAISMSLAIVPRAVRAQQNPAGMALPHTAKIADTFTPLRPGDIRLTGGMLGERIDANAKNRMLKVDEDDMLDCFERRNTPHQDWQGEHVGKFLHAATLAWQNTHDPALKIKLDRVVTRLLKTQEANGYLGTYPIDKRWTSWDVWCHKYALIGLLTYYQYTNGEEGKRGRGGEDAASGKGAASGALTSGSQHPDPTGVLAACRKIGDLLVRTFGNNPGQRDINKSGEHMGMAPDSVLEAIVLLYRATDDPRYEQFAQYIVQHYDAPGGPAILASLEKTHSVRKVANAKAYEMTSNFNGILELYRVTGNRRYLDDMRTAWQDIVDNRLYITGSASSYELYQDDFHLPTGQNANICETCVTVTWEQMNLELLRLTGEARFADQLERSVYNHLLGAQKPTGDDWAYYTPLEGRKPYDKFTTCCHSSGPRGIALIPEFAVMASKDGGLVVNTYNSETAILKLPSGSVTLKQETAYPLSGKIQISVTPEKNGQKFPLRLRLPAWSPGFALNLNGKMPPLDFKLGVAQYLTLNRAWKKGDVLTLTLDLPSRLVLGDHENAGKAAIMYGPLVLAADASLNTSAASLKQLELATDNPTGFKVKRALSRQESPVFTAEGHIAGQGAGKTTLAPIALTPYADAGADARSRFEVWIPLPGQAKTGEISLLSGGRMSVSRRGNMSDSIADDDTASYAVTYNNKKADADWFAVAADKPILINRVVFAHGRTFHDGGWFDASAGKPQIQVQTVPGGAWQTVATIDAYPNTTATNAGGLQPGQTFTVKFAAIQAGAVRVIGKPASGDNPAQAFASCAELQAFSK